MYSGTHSKETRLKIIKWALLRPGSFKTDKKPVCVDSKLLQSLVDEYRAVSSETFPQAFPQEANIIEQTFPPDLKINGKVLFGSSGYSVQEDVNRGYGQILEHELSFALENPGDTTQRIVDHSKSRGVKGQMYLVGGEYDYGTVAGDMVEDPLKRDKILAVLTDGPNKDKAAQAVDRVFVFRRGDFRKSSTTPTVTQRVVLTRCSTRYTRKAYWSA